MSSRTVTTCDICQKDIKYDDFFPVYHDDSIASVRVIDKIRITCRGIFEDRSSKDVDVCLDCLLNEVERG